MQTKVIIIDGIKLRSVNVITTDLLWCYLQERERKIKLK